MSVVVKIHNGKEPARVDYEDADSIEDDEEGRLYVYRNGKCVGIHNYHEWKYAAVIESKCKRRRVAELATEILDLNQ